MNRRLLLLLPPLTLAAPPAPAQPADSFSVAICGGIGSIDIPLNPGKPHPRREGPCAVACHAMVCERRGGKPGR